MPTQRKKLLDFLANSQFYDAQVLLKMDVFSGSRMYSLYVCTRTFGANVANSTVTWCLRVCA